jgi:hypothetical protein
MWASSSIPLQVGLKNAAVSHPGEIAGVGAPDTEHAGMRHATPFLPLAAAELWSVGMPSS